MTQMKEAEDRLRRMILDMEIGPGERLTERWIEGQLGISRTSVRPALFRLEAEGLVNRAERGWVVPAIDPQEIEQLFVYREVLEVAALRLGDNLDNEPMLDAIQTLLDSMTLEATPEQIDDAGREFHQWIAGLSHNEFISRGVADAMLRLRRARWLENDPLHQGWDEHRAILDALRKGQADQAAQLLETHIRDARHRLLSALNKNRRSLRARGFTVKSTTSASE